MVHTFIQLMEQCSCIIPPTACLPHKKRRQFKYRLNNNISEGATKALIIMFYYTAHVGFCSVYFSCITFGLRL